MSAEAAAALGAAQQPTAKDIERLKTPAGRNRAPSGGDSLDVGVGTIDINPQASQALQSP